MKWIDLNNDEIIINKNFSEWATYNSFGVDISLDNLDNSFIKLVKKRTSIVNQVLKLKESKIQVKINGIKIKCNDKN